MRFINLKNKLSTHLSKFWPRKLIHRIALINVIILMFTIGVLSWYSLSEKTAYQSRVESEHFRDHAAQIARLSKPFLRTDSIDELEAVISSFMEEGYVYSVFVKDVGFNNVIALKNTSDNIVINLPESRKIIAPVKSGELVQQSDDKLEVWYKIDEEESLGWIYINRELQPLAGLTLAFVKTTTTVLLFSISICLLLLHRIMREPMRTLRRATEFAEWLDMTQGNHLQTNTTSKEVEYLVHTLNKTSEKMYQKGQIAKRDHLLVDAIREIQTKYIENTKPQELYKLILDKVVGLSGDEYGFFAEVKRSADGKQFLKMRTFTKLAESVSIQNFVENNSPPNMEFHNSYNLLGAVLQTRKPVIANDPARDPRSGGMPKGHPPIIRFMALPVFNDDDVVGVIGLANRRGGYDQQLVDYLNPLLTTAGHIVVANKFNKRRRIARKNLEQREVLLRRILSTVSDSIVTINMGGFIETVNPATEKMFGFLDEEMLNKHINTIIPNLFDREFDQRYVSVDSDHYFCSEGVTKDGGRLPIEFMVSEFKISDEKMYTVTIIDISHLATDTLIPDSEHQVLKTFKNRVLAGPWKLNTSTNIISASQEVFNIFDITGVYNEVSFDRVVDAILEDDRPVVRLAFEKSIQNQEEFVVDVRLKPAGKQQRYAQIQGSPVIHEDGKSVILEGVIQDVTKTNNLIKRKDEFISTVTEEIRSPLASIRGSIGALSTQLAKYVTEKEKFLLDTAYQNTDRLILLINDILDIENMATGKTEFQMEFLECHKVLDAVTSANTVIEKDYGVKFEVFQESRGIVLIADKRRLLQLLHILCLNAAKHSVQGSTISINASIDDGQLLLTVEDRGEGIPDEVKAKVFDLYARTEYFRSDHPESTGLGLCVAKSIVERHAGNIEIDSQVGVGTTVSIRFPIPQQNIRVLNL